MGQSGANVVGSREEAPLNSVSVLQAIGTHCKKRIDEQLRNEKVPQSESASKQIGHDHIGSFAREGIGIGAKTVYGKSSDTAGQFRVGA